jgi:hypothetical protein
LSGINNYLNASVEHAILPNTHLNEGINFYEKSERPGTAITNHLLKLSDNKFSADKTAKDMNSTHKIPLRDSIGTIETDE